MYLKICGITRQSDYDLLIQYGVSFAGFIFYNKSKRFISFEDVSKIKENSETSKSIKRVGVFVNPSIAELAEGVKIANLDYVQLHGDENSDFVKVVASEICPVIKAFRLKEKLPPSFVEAYQEASLFLCDGYNPIQYGGAGERIDSASLTDFAKRCDLMEKPFLIAGGLSATNLHEYTRYKAAGFDLSSSVEISPGVKDPQKMRELIEKFEVLAYMSKSDVRENLKGI